MRCYQAGDRVRIKKRLALVFDIVEPMRRFEGMTTTVISRNLGFDDTYRLKIDGGKWTWYHSLLEPISSEENEIE